MKISDRGIALIKECEGFKAVPYNCPAGHSTIGYGTLLHRGPVDIVGNELDKQYKNGISRDQAEELLRVHVSVEIEPELNRVVKVALSQNQFDALCDFCYNLGVGALKSSTLLKKLNEGQYAAIPLELERWIYSNGKVLEGLKIRRRKEITLWKA